MLTRKSHNYAGTAFVQRDSAGGSNFTNQTLNIMSSCGEEPVKITKEASRDKFQMRF